MNYFLVNNGFHLDDALEFIENDKPTLITIPHRMNCAVPSGFFNKVVTFKTPVRDVSKAWLYSFGYFSSVFDINKQLHPQIGDVLFVYTEYELLNQYIAQKFKQCGAKVILIEEGIATLMISHELNAGKSLFGTFNDWWVKRVFGLTLCRMASSGSIVFPLIRDDFWHAFCVYNGISSKRKIPIFKIKHRSDVTKHFDLNHGVLVFLNEPVYDGYVDYPVYLNILRNVLSAFSANFKEVLFKFHPRETAKFRAEISKIVEELNLQIIETDLPAEQVCKEIRPSHVASFMSAALLKVIELDIQPIFLHHLLPGTNSVYVAVDQLLQNLGIESRVCPNKMTPNTRTVRQESSERMSYTEFLNEISHA